MTTSKNENELVADFLPRLVSVVKTLRDQPKENPTLLVHIGAITSDIVTKTGKMNWPQVKAALTNEDYDTLLKDCQTKSEELAKQGEQESAYALEVIAISTIASRFSDVKIAEGNKLLDGMINNSARAYNTAKIKPANN